MTTRTLLFCFLSMALPAVTAAQELLTIHKGCHFDGDDNERELYGYAPSNEAQQIISRITAVIGLEQNFVIKSANVANALATGEGKQRYILYSTTFLERFKGAAQTQWAAYCVLAHEIGHHLNNHDFDENDSKRRKLMELAADRFAGNILYKMGASLEEAQAGINTFSLVGETNTHPPKSARLEAVANGWKQAKEGVPIKVEPYVASKSVDNVALAKDWFSKGYDALEKTKNYQQAIEFNSEAIRLNPNYAEAYANRGMAKHQLGKYNEAIEDYNQAIRLNPIYAVAYYNRGLAKYNLLNFNEALEDYNQAIRLNPNHANAYYNRSATKYELGKYSEAIKDCDEAIRLNSNFMSWAYANKGRALVKTGQYLEGLQNIQKAMDLDSSLKTAAWVQDIRKEAISKL